MDAARTLLPIETTPTGCATTRASWAEIRCSETKRPTVTVCSLDAGARAALPNGVLIGLHFVVPSQHYRHVGARRAAPPGAFPLPSAAPHAAPMLLD